MVLSNIRGVNLQGEFDNGFSWRFGYLKGKDTIKSPTALKVIGYVNASAGTNEEKQDAISNLDTDKASASFTGFVTYDQDDIVPECQYGRRGVEDKDTFQQPKVGTPWQAIDSVRCCPTCRSLDCPSQIPTQHP